MTQSLSIDSKSQDVTPFNIRIALLGAPGAGKTSILSNCIGRESVLSHKMPVQGFTNALFNYNERIVALDVIDHSSSCQHSALDYPGITTCDVFILVFTMGNMESFEKVAAIRQRLMTKRRNGRPPVIAIVGNKADEYSNSVDNVITELTTTCDWGHLYFETSVFQDETIQHCFGWIIKNHFNQSGQLQVPDSQMEEYRRASCPILLLSYRQRLSQRIHKRNSEKRKTGH